ncbi:MAG TPA: GntR family transcriptional regulator, partial [Cytophagaceae bacterium]
QQVDLLVYEVTDLGYMCIIDSKYKGMLYKNEVFRPLQVGDTIKGFVRKVREDGKVDLILNKPILDEINDSKEIILSKLKENDGELRFSDKSDPEDIKNFFHLSKKNFKRALGSLYKDQKIAIEEDKIRLLNGG